MQIGLEVAAYSQRDEVSSPQLGPGEWGFFLPFHVSPRGTNAFLKVLKLFFHCHCEQCLLRFLYLHLSGSVHLPLPVAMQAGEASARIQVSTTSQAQKPRF